MSDRTRRPWTVEEDNLLRNLVQGSANVTWTVVAENFDNRSGKQCRERWINHVNPEIDTREWTQADDELLYKMHKILGNKWATIAKSLPGRSEYSIKNRWNTTIRKKILKGALESTSKLNKITESDYGSVPIRPLLREQLIPPKNSQVQSSIVSTAPQSLMIPQFSVPINIKQNVKLMDQQLMQPMFDAFPPTIKKPAPVESVPKKSDLPPPPCVIRKFK